MVLLPNPSPPVFYFKPKYRTAVHNNVLTGITLRPWLQLLWRHRDSVDWLAYGLRLLFLTLMACINSLLALVEHLLFARSINNAKINPRPVFIVGLPRSGTTFLHNLLSMDERFYAPNLLQCGFASTCFILEPFGALLNKVITNKRPMDNMDLSMQVPQEDELALNCLSGCTSGYGPMILMTQAPFFRRFLTMHDASVEEKARWLDALFYFLRKISLRAGERRLLLKSPGHTGKIRLLLELFPEAQFIYIHRNPYSVFRSAVHMADTTFWYSYLSTPTTSQILDCILSQYETLHEAYIDARPLIPKGQLYEMTFAELEKDPVGELGRAYEHLGWAEHWKKAKERIGEYCKTQEGYQKNKLDLTEEQCSLVRQRWARLFEDFGYDM